MTNVLLIVVGLAALSYVGAPMLIRFTLKLKARPRLEPVEPAAMPPEVYDYFGLTAPGFQACGFELAAYIRIPDQVPNVVGYVALWVNRSAGQAATAVVLDSGSSQRTIVKHYAEFLTKVADGIAILTNNSSDLASFKRVPTKDTLYAEVVQDTEQLYRLHLSRESRLAPASAPRYLPEPGQELAYFAEGMEFDLRRQANVGYLYQASPGLYRPTWLGAYMMTWGELPPTKQVRRVLGRGRARRQLREAEIRPVISPRNVAISHVSPYCLPP